MDNLIISKNLLNQSQVNANLITTKKLLVNGVDITSGGGSSGGGPGQVGPMVLE